MAQILEKLTYFGRKIYLFAAKGPAYHYIYGHWRFSNWLQKVTDRSFYLSDTALLAEFVPEKSELVELNHAIATDISDNALASLAAYFRARTNPIFCLDWVDKEKLIAWLQTDQMEATILLADEIVRNIS